MPDRNPRPLWPLLTAALIGLPLLYVASFGPACWLASRASLNVLANADFIHPWVLEQDDPWNVVIGVFALFILWRAINRAADKADPFDE